MHRRDATASTAEQLMRSRYSAFVIGNTDYLLATWHPSTRPISLELDPGLRWYRLDVVAVRGGGSRDTQGLVEFEAHYRSPDGPGSQHEASRFVKEHQRWYYLTDA